MKRERGFAMLLVFVMAAAVAITLYRELPRVAFEAQRNKEDLLIERGEQYSRAIQLYVRKMKKYPQTIEELENTNQLRFLRRRYKDPMTGKEEWRLIRVSAPGVYIDSLVHKPPSAKEEQKSVNTFTFDSNTLNQPGAGQVESAVPQLRPSERLGMRPPGQTGQPADPNDPNAAQQQQQQPGYPPPVGFPQQQTGNFPQQQQLQQNPMLGMIGNPYQSQAGTQGGPPLPPGSPPLPPGVNAPPGAYPQQPRQPAFVQAQPYQQPAFVQAQPYPGAVNPQQPGMNPQQPGMNPQLPYGVPQPGGFQQAIGRPQPYPGQGGVTGPPQPMGIGAPGQPFLPGQPGQPGQQQNPALGMIQQLLTNPRPPAGQASAQPQGQVIGGGIAGIASTMERSGIKVYNERDKYNEWEFLYDMTQDRSAAGAAAGQLPGQGQGQRQGPAQPGQPQQGPGQPLAPGPRP